MERTPERQWLDALSDVLLRSHLFQPDELGGAFADVMATLGVHATIYLADEEQHTLRPVPVPGRAAAATGRRVRRRAGLHPGRVDPGAERARVVDSDGRRHRPARRHRVRLRRCGRRRRPAHPPPL
ncbi:hypothetical protein ACFHW1_23400 [Micromonospora sp. LOL_014]|uniref:hypothetical protein n=1 Tax=Micromonospora sp. LOL_014 TaxID=3345415 RepID=UPI003A8AC2E0